MFGRKPAINENELKDRLRHELMEEREQRRLEIESIELSSLLNKLVICVSNEYDNIKVGYGKEITYITKSQVPMLVVHDIVNNCDILPMGKIFGYTEQKFNALNNLDPNDRIAIVYSATSFTEVKKEPDSEVYEPVEWKWLVDQALLKYKHLLEVSNSAAEDSYAP